MKIMVHLTMANGNLVATPDFSTVKEALERIRGMNAASAQVQLSLGTDAKIDPAELTQFFQTLKECIR